MSTQIAVKGSLAESQKNRNVTFAEAFLTVDAICIVDISSSMGLADVSAEGGKRTRWEEANAQLARLQGKFPAKLAVVAFSDDAEFCPAGVLPYVKGGTNLTGALQFVDPADGTGIKFIVVSDGEPDDEHGVLAVAEKMLTPIDTIYIGPVGGRGEDFLRRLANATKGKAIVKGVSLLEETVTKLLKE